MKDADIGKTYRLITYQRLIDCLEKIGWSVVWHGSDHYVIYNHLKEPTDLFLRIPDDIDRSDVLLDKIYSDSIFGKSSYNGLINIDMEKAAITVMEDWILIKCGWATISFYNHDGPRKAKAKK